MAVAVVEAAGDGDACLQEAGFDEADGSSVVAHGVGVARGQQDGDILGDGAVPFPSVAMVGEADDVSHGGGGEAEVAHLVLQEGLANRLVVGHPGHGVGGVLGGYADV